MSGFLDSAGNHPALTVFLSLVSLVALLMVTEMVIDVVKAIRK
jgi:hypothetical protein